ncbi:hypothetical protein E3J62_07095 [candidate division TA06 bacterium]|uniref:DUF3108 domain-containing protein n=1 Tax=candidate division TA06 bacterium TaxID=2250710 RepID=A0A523USL4_UNCT6|nr:MAG: hypothetical protein E3J62_07095 [candidate division TA06 bacterium]
MHPNNLPKDYSRMNRYIAFALGFAVCSFSSAAFAGAPFELYHVPYDSISGNVLKDAVGILTITSREPGKAQMKAYNKALGKFTRANPIHVLAGTVPVSNFGYHPEFIEVHVASYRFPIVGRSGDYLRIVYKQIENSRTWVKLEELERDFFTYVAMLDSIGTPSWFVSDVFFGSKDGTRKIYAQPKEDAEATVIKKDDYKYKTFRIIEQKGDFVKIRQGWQEDSLGDDSKMPPLGWIKIHDEEGRLTIWQKDQDNL